MDFAFTSEQQDIKALAEKLFGDFCAPEKLPDFEKASDGMDRGLWQALASAGLLGVALPESYGGMGFGIAELCVLLEQAGRFVAPVPLLPTLASAAAAIAEFGTEAQKQRWLPGVTSGRTVLSAALAESDCRDAERPSTRAGKNGAGWKLRGVKICVPAAKLADRIVVPASASDGEIVVALVSPDGDGVELEAQETTTGGVFYRMTLSDAAIPADDVLAGGADTLHWIIERTLAGLCALELGVAERALRMTAKYTAERKQFGKVIATFQAVAQRAADAYIDVEAMRVTAWQAIWRLAQGMPASRELSIAKFWASEGGHRACYAAQHLHGGIGVDKDYPLHRYYLLSKQVELTLGGAHEHLAKLGAALAS